MSNNTIERIRLEEKKEKAVRKLVSEQKCKRCKEGKFTEPVFGQDLNILDYSRTWLYNALKAEAPYMDSEQLRICANKTVLWVNPADVAELIATM